MKEKIGFWACVLSCLVLVPCFIPTVAAGEKNIEESIPLTSRTIEKIFQTIEEKFHKNPQHIQGFNAIYQFDITGPFGVQYYIDMTGDSIIVKPGMSKNAHVTVTISDQDFVDVVTGKLNGQMAFMTGRMKIKGDMGLAMKLHQIIALPSDISINFKPTIHVLIVGDLLHGTSDLFDAIGMRCKAKKTPDEQKQGEKSKSDITVFRPNIHQLKLEGENREFIITTCPSYRDWFEVLVTGAVGMDVAVTVVSGKKGPTDHTRKLVQLASQVGILNMIVFLNDVDGKSSPEFVELIEFEMREMLTYYGFQGEQATIVRGFARKAAQDQKGELADQAIERLITEVDRNIPFPIQDVDRPFLMAIEDIFTFTGRGSVLTGRVEQGRVEEGDEVEIVGFLQNITTRIRGVAQSRKRMDQARAGEKVDLLVQGIPREELHRGQVVAAPGSIMSHAAFEAEIFLLSKEEDGRKTPIFNGYKPQFYFRTIGVTGTMRFPEGVEMVVPGDNTFVTVELNTPIAMLPGVRFAILEDRKTIGAGIVTKVLPAGKEKVESAESNFTVKEYFEDILSTWYKSNPNSASGIKAVYQFHITGSGGGNYFIDLTGEEGIVAAGNSDRSDCIITMSKDEFFDFIFDRLNLMYAFLTGKLSIEGNNALLYKLPKVVKVVDRAEPWDESNGMISILESPGGPVGAIFKAMDKRLKKDSGYQAGISTVYLFHITGNQGGDFFVDLSSNPRKAGAGTIKGAPCKISMADSDFIDLESGRLNFMMGFMSGKIKITGNMGLALKFYNVRFSHSDLD